MSYSEIIDYLYSLQKFGLKLGLNNIEALLEALGRPERDFQSIHVAGTNGKGSTSAIIAHLLSSSGLKTGLFTSPHMVRFTERIRIDFEEIDEAQVVRLTELIRRNIPEGINPTFFEFITALAFKYFSERKVDVAVVEVGMGGRLDATNVINPSVSVITKIGIDHKEFLGETLRDIAREKAGIIKRNVPVVSALQDDEAMEVIEKRTFEMGSPLFIYGRDFKGDLKDLTPSGIIFDYRDSEFELKEIFLPLTGLHQLENACLAIKAFILFLRKHSTKIVPQSNTLLQYCSNIKNLYWPGRLELFKDGGMEFLFDGAHNPQAVERLSQALRDIYRRFYKRIILILGIMADKDVEAIIKALNGLPDIIIATSPDYKRALKADELKKKLESLGDLAIHKADTLRDALKIARDLWRQGDLIVVTGSFYTVGEVKVLLGERESLRTLREGV